MENHSNKRGHGSGHHDVPRGYGPEGHATVGGLALAANGLRFSPKTTRFEPGVATEWEFEILRSDGEPVTEFDTAHGKYSHLIVLRRDLTRFQHLHPTLESDGTWRVDDFGLPDAGVYRAFVDIVVDGQPMTLGFDLFAPGDMSVGSRPDTTRRMEDEEYTVELLTDEIEAGETTPLVFDIREDDVSVSRLEPHLGALGHLVALREGDLAYLHVHPEESDPERGRIEFQGTFPTQGRYRLFLQSKPEGDLITTHHDVRIDT